MIKAVVVDDERPSCDYLAKLLADSGRALVLERFTEPPGALEYLRSNKVDAVFLDIEMPDMDGIELANQILCAAENTAVVFVTAYNEYAVEAFRLNALDYLMKPVEEARLHETLDRIGKDKNIPILSDGVRVNCFGQFYVQTNSGKVKFRTEKAEELFAFLIEQKGNFVSRSMILDSLWEDFDGERALVNFNSTLYNVKKAMLAFGARAEIEYNRGNYRLNVDQFDCDYLKFFGVASGKNPVSDENIADYETAASLYLGDFLKGNESPWAARSRLMLKDYYLDLLMNIGRFYESAAKYEKAAEWMKKGLACDPLHREINYLLIESLLAEGKRTSAFQYYELYKSGFRSKTKKETDNEIEALFQV